MPYVLFPSAPRQGQYDGQVQLTEPASLVCVHAAIPPGHKVPGNSYSAECYLSSDGVNWTFMGGGAHATLGSVIKKGLERDRSDPRLRIQLTAPVPAGTWVRAVCNIPQQLVAAIEIETEADLLGVTIGPWNSNAKGKP
jgi:hypothetical protein